MKDLKQKFGEIKTQHQKDVENMTDNTDYRTYLNEKFENVNIRLDAINCHLAKINGRVQKHDEIINDAIAERVGNRVEHKEALNDLITVRRKVSTLDADLMEYKMAKKYPKVFAASMFIMGGAIILLTLHSMGWLG